MGSKLETTRRAPGKRRAFTAWAVALSVGLAASCGGNTPTAKRVSREAVLVQTGNEPASALVPERSTPVATSAVAPSTSSTVTPTPTTAAAAPSSTTAAPASPARTAPVAPPAPAAIMVEDGAPERALPAQAPRGPSIIARTRGGYVPAFARIPADPDHTVPTWNFEPETMFGSPLTFLVTAEEGRWLQVVLPIRDNNTRGWIPRETVTVASTNLRAVVSIGARKVTIYDGEGVLAETSAVVGKPSTPTPTGLFYVTDVIDTENPGGVYGPYVLALSARSEVFDFFNGGEPLTALHGTSSPGLIGTAASNGCIRLPNDMSTFLASRLPLGTAVYIQP